MRFAAITAFVITALVAVVAAAFMPAVIGLHVVSTSGYWIVALLALFWVVCMVDWGRGRIRKEIFVSRPFLIGCALVVSGTLFLVTREPFAFKVTMDEVVLSCTAMNMHFYRSAEAFSLGYDLNGGFEKFGSYLDKRPLFFPWLLSVVHDITGYRVGNVHALNVILTSVLLALVYGIGYFLKGLKGAIVSVLLLLTLPLLAQNATGAGFEVLNAVLICASVLLALRFLQVPEARTQALFIATILLLAHTRYESVLYVFFAGGVIVVDWILRRRLLVSGALIVAPLALITIPWHLRIFKVQPSFWQLPPNLERPFGPEFLTENLGHLMNYLLSIDVDNSNAHALGLLTLVALPLLLVSALGSVLRREADHIQIVLGLFLATVLINLGILLGYHWGQVDKFEVSRLLLPAFVAGAFCGSAVLLRFTSNTRAIALFLLVVLAGSLAFSIPATSRHIYSSTNFHARRMEWAVEFHRSLPKGNYLFITNNNLVHGLYRVSALPVWRADLRASQVKYHLENRTFNEAFVIQNVMLNPETGEEVIDPGTRLSAAYELEKVAEYAFRPQLISRISRVKRIQPELAIPSQTDAEVPPGEVKEDPLKDHERFLLRWGENLP